jgi:hypothetical protein
VPGMSDRVALSRCCKFFTTVLLDQKLGRIMDATNIMAFYLIYCMEQNPS